MQLGRGFLLQSALSTLLLAGIPNTFIYIYIYNLLIFYLLYSHHQRLLLLFPLMIFLGVYGKENAEIVLSLQFLPRLLSCYVLKTESKAESEIRD